MKFNLKPYSFFLLILASIAGYAQDTVRMDAIDSVVCFSADGKGNVFVADNENTLYKIDSNGNKLANVNTKVYGSIHKIDCNNPFEIYTYHQDQNVVVYYDNMLNIRGVTKLNDLYFSNVSTISRSFDNGLWLFNLDTYTLERIRKDGKVQAQSYNLAMLLRKEVNVIDIQEFNNHVYLLDSTNGIHQFDLFGTYKTTFYLHGYTQLNFDKDAFVLSDNSSVITYYPIARDYDIVELPVARQMVVLPNDKWYFLIQNKIVIR